MHDTSNFFNIFAPRPGRSSAGGELHFRDFNLVADIKARISGLAAQDNRTRDAGWEIAFSPLRHDELTARSLFDATLTSARQGERVLGVAIASDWVQVTGGGAMESSIRDARYLQMALGIAFRRAVLQRPDGVTDPAAARLANA